MMPNCDKCHKDVDKVKKIPYLYLDMNCKKKPDLGDGYRQYEICKECWKKEFEEEF